MRRATPRTTAGRRILAWIHRVEETLVVVCFAATVGVVSLQVILRYGFNAPLLWTEIAARLFFAWSVFLGTALAFRYHYHIRIDVLLGFLPRPLARICELLADAVVAGMLLFLAYYGLRYAGIAWNQRVAPYEFSYASFSLAVPVSALIMLFHLFIGGRRAPPDTANPPGLG